MADRVGGLSCDRGNHGRTDYDLVCRRRTGRSDCVRENLKNRAALYGITGKAFEKRLRELVEKQAISRVSWTEI